MQKRTRKLQNEEKRELSEEMFLKRLITEVYPTGIVSVVSDTFDFWRLVTEILPRLKKDIIARWEKDPNSKVVIRPDSGVPHKILNGESYLPSINGEVSAFDDPERYGLIRCLDQIFGSTVNDRGFKRLHPAIGAIYGDGINVEEATRILEGLKDNGYESTSVVLGLGSFTYQYVTRDTYGTVCKATNVVIKGESYPIFKAPKTGAWKKSHKGLLRVNEDLTVSQDVTVTEETEGLLKTVFANGSFINVDKLNWEPSETLAGICDLLAH
jgi:nicotinamide phosphoribosyltransferase